MQKMPWTPAERAREERQWQSFLTEYQAKERAIVVTKICTIINLLAIAVMVFAALWQLLR